MAVETGKPGTNWKQVTPGHRKRIDAIVRYYMKKAKPFTECVRDNRKRFGDRAEKVCAVVKDMGERRTTWRKGGKGKVSEADVDGVMEALLEAAGGDLHGVVSMLAEGAAVEAGNAVDAVFGVLGEEGVSDLLVEKTLSGKARKQLSSGSFAIPERKAYPIHDLAHARNALSRVAQHGSEAEKARVRAAVKRKHPKLRETEIELLSTLGEETYGGLAVLAAAGIAEARHVGLLAEADGSMWAPTSKKVAAADGEAERHEVYNGGQHVGYVAKQTRLYSNDMKGWRAQALNGDRVGDYSSSQDGAHDQLRAFLETAGARLSKTADGKWMVAKPSTYGETTYREFPSEDAARHYAGLPPAAEKSVVPAMSESAGGVLGALLEAASDPVPFG
jgi:hypothetical protein